MAIIREIVLVVVFEGNVVKLPRLQLVWSSAVVLLRSLVVPLVNHEFVAQPKSHPVIGADVEAVRFGVLRHQPPSPANAESLGLNAAAGWFLVPIKVDDCVNRCGLRQGIVGLDFLIIEVFS